MNEFNVLLNAATNGAPSGSLFDALFARYIAPQESWRELESPLPITILAAGKDLIDYRIFGNTENGESVGERTESGEPTGYKLPMKISHKVALTSDDLLKGVWLASNGEFTTQYPFYICTQKMPVESGALDVYVKMSKKTNELAANFYSGDRYLGYRLLTDYKDYAAHSSFEVPMGATECAISVGWYGGQSLYPSDAEVFDINWIMATPPIYIGSDPLAEDEYVDFGEQKIYRMVNGTLTPTDPPVPLPALPTIRGETIIDYNPSKTPAVEPEKMYVKYKP